ncbi:MAG: hypothetical protein WBC04_23770 [Candidatus Acidiferrales bacterium]
MSDAANSALSALAFLEGSALIFLLVVYALLARECSQRHFRFWISGWVAWTICGLAHLFPIGSDPKLAQLTLEELYFGGTLLLLVAGFLSLGPRANRCAEPEGRSLGRAQVELLVALSAQGN